MPAESKNSLITPGRLAAAVAAALAAGAALTVSVQLGGCRKEVNVDVHCDDGCEIAAVQGSPPPQGWLGSRAAKGAAGLVDHLPPFEIRGDRDHARDTVLLWNAVRKANGGVDLANIRQQIGDCVSWGWSRAISYLDAVRLARNGGEFRRAYPPYIYGISRVQIGGGRLSGDGSLGAWAAAGVQRYGVVAEGTEGVPAYSGSVAREWGRNGPPTELIRRAKHSLVGSAALVKTAGEMRDAICNGYTVPICSGFGTKTIVVRDGRRVAKWDDSWAHCMVLTAYDGGTSAPNGPYFYCENSWGPGAHPEPLNGEPRGGFWIHWDDVQRIAGQGDSYAVSQFAGFPARELDFDLFAFTTPPSPTGLDRDPFPFHRSPGDGRFGRLGDHVAPDRPVVRAAGGRPAADHAAVRADDPRGLRPVRPSAGGPARPGPADVRRRRAAALGRVALADAGPGVPRPGLTVPRPAAAGPVPRPIPRPVPGSPGGPGRAARLAAAADRRQAVRAVHANADRNDPRSPTGRLAGRDRGPGPRSADGSHPAGGGGAAGRLPLRDRAVVGAAPSRQVRGRLG